MTTGKISRKLCCLIAVWLFAHQAKGDHFIPLDTIPSLHGVYYTTMAPHEHFLAMGDQRSPGAGVDIINIADPANMTLAANIPTGHMTYELAWSGNFIYCPASWDGLYIYDVSDINNIVLAYDSSFHVPMSSVIVRDNTALVGSDYGLYVFNVSNPHNPVNTSRYQNMAYFNAVLGDTILYGVEIYQYVLFICVSIPQRPYLINTLFCPDVMGLEIDESRNLMYIVTQGGEIKVYDISDIENPNIIGQTDLPDGAGGFDIDFSNSIPGLIVVSGLGRGIFAVDVTDPFDPVITANWPTPLQSHYVLIDKGIVYNTSPDYLYSLSLDTDNLSIDDDITIPQQVVLAQNYPNPFNPTTSITFTLQEDQFTTLEIYNCLGQKVTTLMNGNLTAGQHAALWDASGCSSGQYYYWLKAGNQSAARGMLFVK
jgi:hypothetical protein